MDVWGSQRILPLSKVGIDNTPNWKIHKQQNKLFRSNTKETVKNWKWLLLGTLATSCKELTHWKRLWCWEGLGAGGEGNDRGWDGWMASLTRWTWVSMNSGSWWWTGRPGVLQFTGSQRVGHDWATDLIWSDLRDWEGGGRACFSSNALWRDFPGRQVAKPLHSQCKGPGVWSLTRELDPTCCNSEFTRCN